MELDKEALKKGKREILWTKKYEKCLYSQIESYPAQNAQITEEVIKSIGIKVNNFIKGKILIMLPTFSPYY